MDLLKNPVKFLGEILVKVTSLKRKPIELTHPKDRSFAAIAQDARVRNTTLPSGYKTPDRFMRIKGTTLVDE